MKIELALKQLGIQKKSWAASSGLTVFENPKQSFSSISPVNGKEIGWVAETRKDQFKALVKTSEQAFDIWKRVPAPKRGEIVRQIGEELREQKIALGTLVSYEMGKSIQEGLGEVQEMIDIADFAVGLSRQLHGLTMHSERAQHRMYEQYHPLGIVGIISAFNFPVAVWSWNAFIAWVCGDVCIWKPSEKAPLCAIACQNIVTKVFEKNMLPDGISVVVQGGAVVGKWITEATQIPLVSATGSVRMGKIVARTVGERLGRTLLELGGNNAIIITPDANIDLTINAVVFGAVGTCGQRCTTTRRVIVHQDIFEQVKKRLINAYSQIKVGNPLEEGIHVGPLIDEAAVKTYIQAIKAVQKEGGKVLIGGKMLGGKKFGSACYVEPAIVEVKKQTKMVKHETFAPILYIMKYDTLEEAISLQNEVPQGLSSAIMTNNIRESELFLSAIGSDCGIANVNIGTSGAEIGGAFGGEKETGGGRESGSDAWKVYMRRQTNTINYGNDLPLAQGIKFNLE